MKKSIIVLMGLFTLVACSEDSVQEVDKLNETGNVENTDPKNQVYTHDPSIPYDSPYDLGSNRRPINYIFINNTPYELYFHAWVSLCYYDGANDGIYFGNAISPGAYPLFTFSPFWNEYETYVTTARISIPPNSTQTITTVPGMNLPADPNGPKTANGQFFEFNYGGVPTTPQEVDLLTKYGKFIGLESSFGTVKFHFLNPGNSLGSAWLPVPASSSSSLFKQFYNTSSMEVCTITGGVANHPSVITSVKNGVTYTLKAYTTSTDVVVEVN